VPPSLAGLVENTSPPGPEKMVTIGTMGPSSADPLPPPQRGAVAEPNQMDRRSNVRDIPDASVGIPVPNQMDRRSSGHNVVPDCARQIRTTVMPLWRATCARFRSSNTHYSSAALKAEAITHERNGMVIM
jgi:hypothetical protein